MLGHTTVSLKARLLRGKPAFRASCCKETMEEDIFIEL
jgi:hypothetical protein